MIDALRDAFGSDFTIACPVFPENRRTVASYHHKKLKLLLRVVVFWSLCFGAYVVGAAEPVTPLGRPDSKLMDPLTLWYRKPAEYWGEALPLGNGRLGAMVFGRVDRERIALNESTFWTGGVHDYANPGALQPLQQARAFILKQRYREADQLLSQVMQGNPSIQASYQPVGDLLVEVPVASEISNYDRKLSLAQGLASVSYSQGGISYKREGFISAVDQVGVIRWTASAAKSISFSLWFESSQETTAEVENNELLVVEGKVPAARSKIPNKLQFVSRIKVLPVGGEMKASGNKIEVRNADSIMILWDVATNYRNYHDITADPDAITHDRISRASGKSFQQLLTAHLTEQKRLFSRVSFDLADRGSAKATDERLKAGSGWNNLAALYFQFGRYTLLSSSRPGGQPATICGIWNENPIPANDSKYLLFGPTLMAYWPIEAANLSECFQPVKVLSRQLSETGARTAALMFAAGGWVCFGGTDLWRGSAPSDGAAFYTPVGGAALASLLWKHFLYTGDQQFLTETYLILKNASQFFLDSLQRQTISRHESSVICPTVSPGSQHSPGAFSAAGTTFDSTVLRQLFECTADAARMLDTDQEFRDQLLSARAKLPPLRIDSSGRIPVWLKDWPAQNGGEIFALYGLFPYKEISKHLRLITAARKTLESTDGPPWMEAWRACLWARLHDGNRAWRSLKALLQPARISPNFFGPAPGFELTTAWGATTAMLEMLLQNNEHGELELLPALPDAWGDGSISGIRAEGGFEVDLKWEKGRLNQLVIRSLLGRECKIRYKNKCIAFPTEKGRQYQLDASLKRRME